ncbi:MAG TPA: hypothetical protein VG456_01735 [Candidatus Sulfopaludibacter sp.]|jgi:hypothetical protein|nr:hypothetical protein [Candidatus Sulfopaludibacter sp.]
MIFRLPILLLILAALLVPRAASGGGTSPQDPKYDPATTVDLTVVVVEIREVARSTAMHGIHLTVEAGRESLDVYLGPVEFMKSFDFSFSKGDRIQILGSRIKSATNLVLAREIHRQSQTVYLRDSSGAPYWPPGS